VPARVWRWFERAVDALATACFVTMFVAAGAQVVFRYVLEIAVPWTEELARLLFVLGVLAGIAIAIRQRDHIVVDFLLKKLPPRGRIAVATLFNAAILVFLIYLAAGAVIMAQTTWGSYLITLPFVRTAYLYIAQLGAMLLCIVYVGAQALETLRGGSDALGRDAPT
jgi:TRAP-type C4-dicarboxylate transport system permease small subunit